MTFDNYTLKAQELLAKAAESAADNGQISIEPGHLMKGVLGSDENMISFLFKKSGVNKETLQEELEKVIRKYPKATGQQPYLSNDSNKVLQSAARYLKDFKDEFVAVEHIFLGILSGSEKVSQLLKQSGFTKNELIKAIKELRGNNKVTDKNAEAK